MLEYLNSDLEELLASEGKVYNKGKNGEVMSGLSEQTLSRVYRRGLGFSAWMSGLIWTGAHVPFIIAVGKEYKPSACWMLCRSGGRKMRKFVSDFNFLFEPIYWEWEGSWWSIQNLMVSSKIATVENERFFFNCVEESVQLMSL